MPEVPRDCELAPPSTLTERIASLLVEVVPLGPDPPPADPPDGTYVNTERDCPASSPRAMSCEAALRSLIQVLRILNRIEWLRTLEPAVSISPVQMLKTKAPRQRASPRQPRTKKT